MPLEAILGIVGGLALVSLLHFIVPYLPEDAHARAHRKLREAEDRERVEAERKKYADTLPAFSAETERHMKLHDVVE